MKLTTATLKKLIKEQMDDMEQQEMGQIVFLIMERSIDYAKPAGMAFRSKEAAEAKASELAEENENPFAEFNIIEIELMD